jgi:RNA polymerase sigma-70 factor, ECF subfamily
MFGVHRATAARWLARVRHRLQQETLDRLAARLRLGTHEVESVLRLIRSELDVSLTNALKDD